MKIQPQLACWVLALVLSSSALSAGFPTIVNLDCSPKTSTFGQAVTLTAGINSPETTGTITFYDGTTVLGTRPVSGRQAVLTTSLLPSGTQLLKAHYSGDDSYDAGTSLVVKQIVNSLPQSGFKPAVNYPVGHAVRVTAGDLNGDGKTDLVVVNRDERAVSVLLGTGNGTFQPKVDYSANKSLLERPTSVALGDFNGDGKTDLAVANFQNAMFDPSGVSVLLGNGDGTFQSAVDYTFGNAPFDVVVGDFDGDGKADLAVADYVRGGGVWVLIGKGDGTFLAPVRYASEFAIVASRLAVGDFNGDGNADLALASYFSVSVLLGNGKGGFQPSVNYSAGDETDSVAVGDFNGDGKADLAVGDFLGQSVNVLLGKGDGTFQSAVKNGIASGPTGVEVGDFNGDGNADLVLGVAIGRGNTTVSVLLGKGDGTFGAAVYCEVGLDPYSVAVGDFNGDGRTDLVTANYTSQTISILLGAPPVVTSKNSASYAPNVLAADMIAFGEAPGIVPTLLVASTTPWPAILGGAHLDITDSQGQTRAAPLYYVSPGALSFLVPSGTALGPATMNLTTSTGVVIPGALTIERVSPGLFTANASGSGVPAGFWIRVAANGAQNYDYLFDPAQPVGSRVAVPVDLGLSTDKVFLSLYGTGFRGAGQATATVGGVTVNVAGFAAVGVYQGEDVINIGPIPRSLAGRGQVDIVITFDGKPANTVVVSVR